MGTTTQKPPETTTTQKPPETTTTQKPPETTTIKSLATTRTLSTTVSNLRTRTSNAKTKGVYTWPAMTIPKTTPRSRGPVYTWTSQFTLRTDPPGNQRVREKIFSKVEAVFSDLAAATTKLRMNGLVEVKVVAASTLENTRDGKRMTQRVRLQGYSESTFTKIPRGQFCDFVTNEAGVSAGTCEILSVKNEKSTSSSGGRRVLTAKDVVIVHYAVLYNESNEPSMSRKSDTSDDKNDNSTTTSIIVVLVVLCLVAGIVVAVLMIARWWFKKSTVSVVPQDQFTDIYSIDETEDGGNDQDLKEDDPFTITTR